MESPSEIQPAGHQERTGRVTSDEHELVGDPVEQLIEDIVDLQAERSGLVTKLAEHVAGSDRHQRSMSKV